MDYEEMLRFDAEAELAKTMRALRAVQEIRAEKRIRHTSAGGSVSVLIDGNGKIHKLVLARGATRSIPARLLGKEIRDTINAARAEAARRSGRLVDVAVNGGGDLASVGFDDPEERK